MTGEEIGIIALFVVGIAVVVYLTYFWRRQKWAKPGPKQSFEDFVSSRARRSDPRVDYGAGLASNGRWRELTVGNEIEEATAASTILWDTPPERFVPSPEHWGLALTLPFAVWHRARWDALPGDPAPEAVSTALTESWGIDTRTDLLEQLYWLYVAGHRAKYNAQRSQLMQMDSSSIASLQSVLAQYGASDQDAGEELWQIQRVRSDDRRIGSIDFTAWDMFRFAMLVRLGSARGHITVEEAHDFLAEISPGMRASYSSWSEAGEHFRIGRWYWHGEGGDAERSNDVFDLARQDALTSPDAPWSRIPWNMGLPRARGLFARALIAEQIIRDPHELTPQPESFWGAHRGRSD